MIAAAVLASLALAGAAIATGYPVLAAAAVLAWVATAAGAVLVRKKAR